MKSRQSALSSTTWIDLPEQTQNTKGAQRGEIRRKNESAASR